MSSVFSSARLALSSAGVALLVLSCSTGQGRFPLKDPLWVDEGDFREFSPAPEEYEPATFWEVFDHTFLRPMPRVFAFEVAGRAKNVNAWDEVPDSSWFTNRMSRHIPTPAEAAKGSCEEIIDPKGPFEVTGGKPDGLNPGFLIKTKTGKKYFFKFDGADQPERATSADVIGSKIYHAVGYPAPCNQVFYFDPKTLKLSPKATIKNAEGVKVPMTQADVQKAFDVVKPNKQGLVRGFASEFLPGRPLGPWRYQDTRPDDPNDVIDHEDRREIRGSGVMSSWTNHFDSRDQNSLTMWIENPKTGKGYVRHNIIDFGDCFGSIWAFDEMSRRHGQTFYLKMGHMLADFATLGTIERPWDRAEFGPAGPTLGYYNAENYVADEWHNGYPLPAYSNMREEDAAWMARIIADLGEEQLNAIIDEAKLENKVLDRELRKAILGRRKKVLARYLGRLSPLSYPTLDKGDVCLRDLAVRAGVADKNTRAYWASFWDGSTPKGNLALSLRPAADSVCVKLPQSKATKDKPQYFILDVTAGKKGAPDKFPLRLHIYHLGGAEYKVAGIERPETSEAPAL